MPFESFEYLRPEMESFTKEMNVLLEQFECAPSFKDQNQLLMRINSMRTDFMSMYNICHIRHTVNTKDEFYEAENNFFDQNIPYYEAVNNRFYELLLASPFRKELEEAWGRQLFVLATLSLKTFKPEILEDMQEENRLSSEYTKLKAAAKIEFQGEEYNLSSIHPMETHSDRELRKAATETKWSFFEKNATQIEEIFHQLVQKRHAMAQKLGYENYIELGYARMKRSDYTPEMVANFRKQIQEFIVPITTQLYQRQAKRLGLDHLMYYDEDFRFASGNPAPQGEAGWIIAQATKMYEELSKETAEFFHFMQDNHLMNLVAQDGKATGGYCTYIGKYKAPYIFSNFNGTSADIDVLTHEAGHAFQVYSSRNIGLNEYQWPTYEACEIHSMSMEFFTWPWMKLFFKQDTNKYKFAHLANSLKFLPYGVAIDEFQHYIYQNPNVSPKERNTAWRSIEKKYLPHRQYGENSFLESGAYWQRQSHLFFAPFYYIDYTLAQICAFQFWKKDSEDHHKAWDDYIRLCKAGGSKSFLELVQLADLISPFDDSCVESVVTEIKTWLNNIDDATF
ncbi:MAG: M3 family oligoendopeptidase [Saprospiraceae bacterium]|nr:M3 family oligoendopeptidase [Saprospiraceae bacterium]